MCNSVTASGHACKLQEKFKGTSYTWSQIQTKFVNTRHIKNLNIYFMSNGPCIDGKSGVKLEICRLVVELKLKMSFFV